MTRSCAELLRGAASDAVFMDALRIASPSLARFLTSGQFDTKPQAQLRKAAVSAVRYEARIRTRATPFGLFAGVAPVRAGDTAKVQWSEPETTRTQVDLDWLSGLIREWESDPALLGQLALRSHAGLLRRRDRLVAITPSDHSTAEGGRQQDEVSVRLTPAVEAALELAAGGARTADIVRELQRRFPDAPAGAADRMIGALVRQEILLTELRPALDGTDALEHVIGVLARLEDVSVPACPLLAALRAIAVARDAYDAAPLGQRREPLAILECRMRDLRDAERLLHVDLCLGADVQLPSAVFDEAATAVGVLWRLSPPVPGTANLRAYHEAFLERYGTDRAVPLTELTDDTVGLGVPAGYRWPQHGTRTAVGAQHPPADAPRDRLLSRMAAEAIKEGRHEVVLDDAAAERLAPTPPTGHRLPRSCEYHFHLTAASDPKSLTRGDFLLTAAPWPGPLEAGATLGRFAGLLGSLAWEVAAAAPPGHSDALDLTIAYQPRTSRARNVSNAPRTTPYRLSLGIPPESDAATELRLEDIAVTADHDRLHAVHLPSGRRVLPRAHHALDAHGQAPNAARLLLEISRYDQHFPRPWDWGPVQDLPYLPRVRYGRTILCPARWQLDELGGHTAAADDRAWAEAVAAWRHRWGVPRHVVIGRYDHRLLLDLECHWHLETLRDMAAKEAADVVVEEPPGIQPEPGSWLTDNSGTPHLAELVVPFHRADAPADAPPLVHTLPPIRGRLHTPGGEWLYAKLYLPERHINAFLRERLSPFLHSLSPKARGTVDRWFFVRYRDEADHLRLRFHGPADALWRDVFPVLRDAIQRWTDDGAIARCVLDTYDPELERYGGPQAQPAAERFFHADSEAALVSLSLARQRVHGWDATALAAMAIASLVDSFGHGPVGRYEEPAAAWLSKFASVHHLPESFRSRRPAWLRLIDPAGGWPGVPRDAGGRALLAAFEERASALRDYAEQLVALDTNLTRIVPSLTHITCNRLLGTNRESERRAHAVARACVIAHADRRRHQR
ncbi:lantibiotic dehydratase [Streptomyces sp. x-80]|uniref:lantibiotic dehydratase n=1 Tax=Streptomyces sp. x-80 TaxID=2789282 RepID=UPI00397ED7DD